MEQTKSLSESLPESVSIIEANGKTVYLVGTAHVSKESVDDVIATVAAVKPDSICIELCQSRFKTMTDKEAWKKMDIFKVIKEGKGTLLLAQLIMSGFYKQLGEKLGVKPGAEMLEGITQANETGASLVLADRDIEITLKRVWGYLGFWNKLKLFGSLLLGMFSGEEINDEMIEELKSKDQLEVVMAEFSDKFPEIKKRLIDERDTYLSQKIRNAPGEKIVAVLGAGHIPGIKVEITEERDITEISQIPPKSIWPKIIKWAIPTLIVGLMFWGLYRKGFDNFVDSLTIWVLVNGALSALGALLAFGHPVSIITAFVAAPITSVNPLLAAGWFAGIAEAWVRKPKVSDFEALANDIETMGGFWRNKVTRVLLVCALANVGSMLGTFIGGFWIGARSL